MDLSEVIRQGMTPEPQPARPKPTGDYAEHIGDLIMRYERMPDGSPDKMMLEQILRALTGANPSEAVGGPVR